MEPEIYQVGECCSWNAIDNTWRSQTKPNSPLHLISWYYFRQEFEGKPSQVVLKFFLKTDPKNNWGSSPIMDDLEAMDRWLALNAKDGKENKELSKRAFVL